MSAAAPDLPPSAAGRSIAPPTLGSLLSAESPAAPFADALKRPLSLCSAYSGNAP